MKSSTVRAISMGIAAASAAVAIGSTVMGNSFGRSVKKMAKKTMNTVSGMMDSIQGMM